MQSEIQYLIGSLSYYYVTDDFLVKKNKASYIYSNLVENIQNLIVHNKIVRCKVESVRFCDQICQSSMEFSDLIE